MRRKRPGPAHRARGRAADGGPGQARKERRLLNVKYPYRDKAPRLAPGVRLAENAVLAGDVTLARGVNVWYGAVLRGEAYPVNVGENTNIQDNAVLHAGDYFPLTLGRDVTVGHAAVVHGCTVGDECLIGMGAILMNGCVIGDGCVVAAGALIPEGKHFPPGHLILGVPARAVRPLSREELSGNRASAEHYLELARDELPPADGEEQA